MEKNKYELLRKKIPEVKLVSITSQNWYDQNDILIPWSGSLYVGPNKNDVYYNVTGSIPVGYYKWNGTKWITTNQQKSYYDYNLPIFLESKSDEMGIMVGFDGDIEQVEQLVNFTYTQSNKTVTVYNTVNPDKLRKITEQTYTISWGDNTTSSILVNQGIEGTNLPSVSHTYSNNGEYEIKIILNSPWSNKRISKIVNVPQNLFKYNPLGSFTGTTVPAYSYMSGNSQNYLNDYDYTNNTGNTISGFTYLSIGKSRVDELKLYGVNQYSGVTFGTDNIGTYTAYTIDNLSYKDYPDGYTMITGTTVGFTKEEVFNTVITRNEHFLGFVEEPQIYSDIFVDRGKQSVLENNFRLCEIESIGELEIYQNEYFLIKKQ
jgi:hypothetical protein